MGAFTQYEQPRDASRWRPLLIAGIILVVVVAAIWALSRGRRPAPAPSAETPYAASLQAGELRLSTAQNFVGAQVTYLEGTIANAGDKTVVATDVQAIFRNTLGEVVDQQTQPLRVAVAPLGHPDYVALATAPLAPNQVAHFRLTFEHISADWNRGYPELKFVGVQTK
jgi:hypothetical protein